MPRRRRSSSPSPQKHRLTLARLASYDDVLSDTLIDQAYYWSRIRKNRENKYLPIRGIKQDEVPQILLYKVIIAKDVEDAEKALLNLSGLRRYIGGLKTKAEKADFRSHLRKYVNLYLTDCPYEVSTTNRYTITRYEAAITARKRIRGGDRINYLCGTLVPLTEAELSDLDLAQRNFSVVQSNRKKNTLIFLGPARFANHDCNANGRLVPVGTDGLEVHATRNIEVGEEITVTYSPGYFGANNQDCLCHTCELFGRNGWTSTKLMSSGSATPASGICPSLSPGDRTQKRKAPLEIEGSPSEPSSPSPKILQLGRPPSLLSRVLTPPASFQSSDDDTLTARNVDGHAFSRAASEWPRANGWTKSKDPDQGPLALDSISLPEIESPPKKRMRLIDQMASSLNAQAPSLKNGPISDSPWRTPASVGSFPMRPEAASSQSPIVIKVESIEQSKVEDDLFSSVAVDAQRNSDSINLAATDHSLSARTVVNTTITEVSRARPSSVLPSIETPTTSADKLTTTSITSKTILTSAKDSVPIVRHPGDYILTRRLLAQPFDRWVQCQTCKTYFLQSNGYQTRRECPRCERHSMLYGFEWPKTDPDPRRLRELAEAKEKEQKATRLKKRPGQRRSLPQPLKSAASGASFSSGNGRLWGRGRGGGRSGRSGKGSWIEGGGEGEREERVLDHRTVNRFIAPEDERDLRRRAKEGLVDGGADSMIAASPTPDRLRAAITARGGLGRGGLGVLNRGLRGSAGTSQDRESGSREESVASGPDGELRRSKRFFAPRMTM